MTSCCRCVFFIHAADKEGGEEERNNPFHGLQQHLWNTVNLSVGFDTRWVDFMVNLGLFEIILCDDVCHLDLNLSLYPVQTALGCKCEVGGSGVCVQTVLKQHPPGLTAAPCEPAASRLTGRTTGGRRVRNVAGIPSCCINQQLLDWLFTSASFSHRWPSLCYTTGGNDGHLFMISHFFSTETVKRILTPALGHFLSPSVSEPEYYTLVYSLYIPKSLYCLKYHCI